MNEILFQQAVELAKAGRKVEARGLLQQILRVDPFNESAWIWYADCAATMEIRLQALETCTRLNPNAQRARESLGLLRRSHQAWDTQPVFAKTAAFIPLTGKVEMEQTDEMKPVPGHDIQENQPGAAASSASLEDEWVVSAGAAVFTVSPDLISAEEFAEVETRAETFLLARMEGSDEPASQKDSWEALSQPVDLDPTATASPVCRTAGHSRSSADDRKSARIAARRSRNAASAVITTLVMAIMFALLIGAFLVIRGA